MGATRLDYFAAEVGEVRLGAARMRRSMPDQEIGPGTRVRRLAEFLTHSDAMRVRIVRPDSDVEVARAVRAAPVSPSSAGEAAAADAEPARVETIVADLVGVFRLGRPTPAEGAVLAGDRELGYVEALGIRNPVRSRGAGRIVAIAAADGAPVEFGQPLFLLDRG